MSDTLSAMPVQAVLSSEKDLINKFAGQETGFIDVLISSSKPPKTHPGASEISKNFPRVIPSNPRGQREKKGRVLWSPKIPSNMPCSCMHMLS
jgi:hypothetical protein